MNGHSIRRYIDLTSCRGCSPEYTYTYQVVRTSAGVTFDSMEILQPPAPIVGGSTTYRFYFDVQEDNGMKFVLFAKYNALQELVSYVSKVLPSNIEPYEINDDSFSSSEELRQPRRMFSFRPPQFSNSVNPLYPFRKS